MKSTLVINAMLLLSIAIMPQKVGATPLGFLKEFQGQQAYEDKRYKTAEDRFKAAAKDMRAFDSYYNLGLSQYQQKNYPEALKNFQIAAQSKKTELKEKAFYNLGNTHYRMEQLPEAVKDYEAALQLDPNDVEAKFNLEFVKRKLQQQKQNQDSQQKNDQQGENKSEQSAKDGSQGKQGQEQSEQQSENQDQQNQNQQDQQQQQPEQQNSQAKQNQSGSEAKNENFDQQQNQSGQPQQKDPKQNNSGDQQNDPDLSGDVTAKNQPKQSEQNSKNPVTQNQQELSPQAKEAERWLNMIEDHAGQILNAQMNESYGATQHPEKDW